MYIVVILFVVFFFNDTPTPEIYPLSLHDPLPIPPGRQSWIPVPSARRQRRPRTRSCCSTARASPRGSRRTALRRNGDRKSTRLNSSHSQISYAVFCLKKKKNKLKSNVAVALRHCN